MKKTILLLTFLSVTAGAAAVVINSIDELKARLSASLDYPLHDSEFYKGLPGLELSPKEQELKDFYEDAWEVLKTQGDLLVKNNGVPRRVFHAKSHGCLTGSLRVYSPNVETRYGLFSHEHTYDVIARFSNGVGWEQHDLLPDVRGIGLKIFGVPKPDGGTQTVDFTMTNSTNPFARDHRQFIEFMKANVAGNLATLKFAYDQEQEDPRELNYLWHFLFSVRPVGSLVNTRFYAGHPYRLNNWRAMKLALFPNSTKKDDPEITRAISKILKTGAHSFFSLTEESIRNLGIPGDYLRGDLLKRAREGEISYTLAMQLESDEGSTPVENTLVEWETPFYKVGTLTFDNQDASSPERAAACEKMRFTPGHFHPEHRPLGNLARGRLFGYEASQIGRGADVKEPAYETPERWRQELY